MTQQEQARLQVLNNLLAGYMTTEQAATLMGVSTRHTRRILAAYRQEGAAALAHGNRGRRPTNATPKTTADATVGLARTRYTGVNHTHLSELLGEREGIEIGRSTLRRILVRAGVSSPRSRRPPKHRVRRQRMPREGMLIQIDGSHHRWLGKDGPQFTLLLAVDDATGCVSGAIFCQEETTRDYFEMLEELIRRWGIPLALYSDRHTVFKQTPGARQKVRAATQFTRAMDELGIQMVFARSPQGKGRVERMAGTFQDRLISELRLAGATTIPEAKRVLADFLPRFNERFRVPAQQPGTAYRPLDSGICLDRILCYKHWRRVARDNTVKYRWRTLQLLPDVDPGSYAGSKVEVLEGLDGTLRVQHEGRIIPSQEAPPRPGVLRDSTQMPARNVHPNNADSGWMHKYAQIAAGTAPNGINGTRKPVTVLRRKPNRRQRAWWKAIHRAKLQGISNRAIAKNLGISRNTVKKYLAAESPEMVGAVVTPRIRRSVTMANYTNGQNR